jgi:hypothetical protein
MFYVINKLALLHHRLYRHWHKTAVCSVSSLPSTSPNFHRSKRIERYRFWLECRDRQVRISAKLRKQLSKGFRSLLSTLKQMPKEHLKLVNKFLSILILSSFTKIILPLDDLPTASLNKPQINVIQWISEMRNFRLSVHVLRINQAHTWIYWH